MSNERNLRLLDEAQFVLESAVLALPPVAMPENLDLVHARLNEIDRALLNAKFALDRCLSDVRRDRHLSTFATTSPTKIISTSHPKPSLDDLMV